MPSKEHTNGLCTLGRVVVQYAAEERATMSSCNRFDSSPDIDDANFILHSGSV